MPEPLAAPVETHEAQVQRAPAGAPTAAAPDDLEEIVTTAAPSRVVAAEARRAPASARPVVRQARSTPLAAAPSGGLSADAVGGVLGAAYELFRGQVGVSAPERMTVGQTGTVMLTVSAKKAAEELRQALDQATGTDSVRTVQAVRLSRTMSARLTGADFEIVTAPNSEVQTGIDLEDDTTWQWQVRPRGAAPVLQLTVTLTAILQVDGTDRTRDERVFTHNIAVDALPPSWGERASDI
jgi:hypothetical protein